MHRFHAIAVAVVCAACVVIHAQAGFAGKWQGATASGRPVVLDLTVKGQQLTGTLTVGQRASDIMDGKVDEKSFSFKVAMDGRTVTCNGRRVDEAIELTVADVENPLILKRVK
jgi:hypothetical protein